MIVVCASDVMCQECGHSFPDHLPNGGSHFEEVGWVRDYWVRWSGTEKSGYFCIVSPVSHMTGHMTAPPL